jgi:hypothetical protein
MKRAFSMLMAIFFLIVIGTLSMVGLRLSSTTTRQTAELYLTEQAELLAQAATEYTVALLLKNLPRGCEWGPIRGNFPNNTRPILTYRVNITYFGTIDIPNTTNDCIGPTVVPMSNNKNGIVMLDVFVKSVPSVTPTPISFHKRTIQKL